MIEGEMPSEVVVLVRRVANLVSMGLFDELFSLGWAMRGSKADYRRVIADYPRRSSNGRTAPSLLRTAVVRQESGSSNSRCGRSKRVEATSLSAWSWTALQNRGLSS